MRSRTCDIDGDAVCAVVDRAIDHPPRNGDRVVLGIDRVPVQAQGLALGDISERRLERRAARLSSQGEESANEETLQLHPGGGCGRESESQR